MLKNPLLLLHPSLDESWLLAHPVHIVHTVLQTTIYGLYFANYDYILYANLCSNSRTQSILPHSQERIL